MKKVVSLLLICVMTISLVGCGKTKEEEDIKVKVGVVMIGDKTDCYNKAHIDGIKEGARNAGIEPESIIWKYNVPETDRCAKVAEELVAQGCTLIISNSYGQQNYMREEADKNDEVDFVSIAGDHADISDLDNYYNAYTRIYEARYVSGVVAGMKIKELVDSKKMPKGSIDQQGNVKVGFVATNACAEVCSGYTAFYLGIKSVYSKVAMKVTYTNARYDEKKEKEATLKLINDKCVVIGQHTNSTAVSKACQKAKKGGKLVFSVGYNINMLPVAKTATLTSAISKWGTYYTELFQAVKEDSDIPQDWAEGFADDAVEISKLGPKVAKGTEQKVNEVIKGISDGNIKIFDTKKFTVNGEEVKAAEIDLSYFDKEKNILVYEADKEEAIDDGAFEESTFRSAPYFNLKIDGITEINAK